jgi:RES domain
MPVSERQIPTLGIWRVGLATDPLGAPPPLSKDDLAQSNAVNRFDSPTGTYRVLYFATDLDGCFAETLARFRPDPGLRDLVATEWDERGYMAPGHVPAEWRHRRLAVRVQINPPAARFLDVEALSTRQHLRDEVAGPLAEAGLGDLDVAAARGPHRQLTRAVSGWAWDNGYAGIRYLSRIDTRWECWAVFDRPSIEIQELERTVIHRELPALQSIVDAFAIKVF